MTKHTDTRRLANSSRTTLAAVTSATADATAVLDSVADRNLRGARLARLALRVTDRCARRAALMLATAAEDAHDQDLVESAERLHRDLLAAEEAAS